MLNTFNDVVWHASWSITGDILAISGGDNKVGVLTVFMYGMKVKIVGILVMAHTRMATTLVYNYIITATHCSPPCAGDPVEGDA